MATYPPNQTTPAKGSGNYLWNWLGSSLKKFGAAISPYITGGGGGEYKKYVALLSQTVTDPPVATVLENTLGGTPVWTYNSTGQYLCTLTGAFPKEKTFCLVTRGYDWGNQAVVYFGHSISSDYLLMYAFDLQTGASIDIQNGPSGNDLYVEIRVYP